MKKFRKIMAVLVAAMMIAATMVPAWAARVASGSIPSTKGKITVSNAQPGETYNAYRILTLISYNDVDGTTNYKHSDDAYAYALLKDSDWQDFFDSSKKPASTSWPDGTPWGSDYISLDKTNAITIGSDEYYVASLVQNPATGFGNTFADTQAGSDDEIGIANYNSSSLVQAFAQAALKYAEEVKSIATPDATGTNSGTSATSLALKYNNSEELTLGYYLIDSTMGSLCSLDTTNNEVSVIDKNNMPSSDKEVKEEASLTGTDISDGWTGYQKVNDASVGQKVWYRGIIDVEKGAQDYVYADKMDAGLSFNAGDVKVYFLPNGVNATAADKDKWIELKDAAANVKITNQGDAYKAPGRSTSADNRKEDFYSLLGTPVKHNWGTQADPVASTFELKFENNFLTWISDNITTDGDTTKLVVVYSATVLDTAKVGEANLNQSTLHYGEEMYTTVKSTETYTWPIELLKYMDKTNSGTKTGLPGAVFALSDNGGVDATHATSYSYDGSSVTGFYKLKKIESLSDSPAYDSAYTGDQYKVVPSNTTGTDGTDYYTQVTTPSTGKIRIVGLDAGTYYLTEITAPNGYNKLSHPVKVEVSTDITNSTTVPATVTESVKYNLGIGGTYAAANDRTVTSGVEVPIENKTSTELPSTGGAGTTVLYIVGGMLIVLAGAYLFFSRKRTA